MDSIRRAEALSPSLISPLYSQGQSLFSSSAVWSPQCSRGPLEFPSPKWWKGVVFGKPPVVSLLCINPTHSFPPNSYPISSVWWVSLKSLPYPQFCCNSSTFSGAESCSGKNILKVGQAKNSNKCGRQHISGSFSKYHNINSTYSPFNLAIPLLRSSPMHRSQMFIWYIVAF